MSDLVGNFTIMIKILGCPLQKEGMAANSGKGNYEICDEKICLPLGLKLRGKENGNLPVCTQLKFVQPF